MTDPLEIYKGEFGNEWMDRNDIDPATRVEAFRKILEPLNITSILEVGCATGFNMRAIKSISDNYAVIGVEPNKYARQKTRDYHILAVEGDCFNIPSDSNWFDLVFTCGVLMHVPVEKLDAAITELFRVSKKYVLLIEYYNPIEKEINHRGHKEFLWKRDYPSFMNIWELETDLIDGGFLGKKDGFDNCHYWLFEIS